MSIEEQLEIVESNIAEYGVCDITIEEYRYLKQQIRAEVIENVKKYIRLKTHYHYADIKEDFLYAHEMYEWLEEQLKEKK